MANNRRLYREEAFARRGKTEPLNGLLRVTAPHQWALLALLGVAVLGLAAWAFFGSVEQSVSARCVLVHPGDRFTVLAESSGNVVELLSDVGARIEAGQPIARIRTPSLSREIALARSRVDAYQDKEPKMTDALDAARQDLIELEALEAAGEFIASPFAGVITSYDLSIGQVVEAGSVVASVRAGPADELEALAMLAPDRAAPVAAGMEAQVMAAGRNPRAARAAPAEVSFVSPRPVSPPAWFSALGVPAPSQSHMVRLALREPPPALADGDLCEMRIVLRRTSLVGLLLSANTN